jgi:predicted RNA-binding protein YlxR (DUF448 family)
MKGRTRLRNPPNERLTRQSRIPAQAGEQAEVPSSPAEAGVQADDDAQPRPAPGKGKRGEHVAERKCVLSGAHDARDNLIRLALGPDGQIAPDVRARAPGRGAWIGVDRPTLDAARLKGKLRGALARAFKGIDLKIPDDLGDRIESALRQSVLDRLGLEARSGTLLTGSERIDAAARKGDVKLLLHAEDAGADGRRKLDQAWRVGSDPEDSGESSGLQGLVIPAQRPILSLALGRQNVVHIAIIDRGAAARVQHALDRWRSFIGPSAGLDAATAGTPVASEEI